MKTASALLFACLLLGDASALSARDYTSADLVGKWQIVKEHTFNRTGTQPAADEETLQALAIVVEFKADSTCSISSKIRPAPSTSGKWRIEGDQLHIE